MKAGDTFRLGGVPIVVVNDDTGPYNIGCRQCVFHGPCTSGIAAAAGPRAVNRIEVWRDGACYPGLHYEVRSCE